MDDQQKQLVAKLKDAQNVLVTVSKNPSVDQLAAAIGFTLALNKLDKHATAVYSGQTPSTIEFLKPEDTLESNTDSLRDFIIALDKSKADKLRYKVEDQVVRIFITPYRTSISQDDLEFSQGDFNVDVVIALGVKEQVDLDDAIEAHGRILHDATVSSIAIEGQPELGSLNLVNTQASSLCEVVTKLVSALDKEILDSQIATALLTGIVAMTDRFSNDRTTPDTMSISAGLMAAGANQQLIANELAEPLKDLSMPEETKEAAEPEKPREPGTLEISHENGDENDTHTDETFVDNKNVSERTDIVDMELPEVEETGPPQVHVDEDGKLITSTDLSEDETPLIGKARAVGEIEEQEKHEELVTRERIIEPPARGGELTANTKEENLDSTSVEMTLPPLGTPPLLTHDDLSLNNLGPLPEEQPEEPQSEPPVPYLETGMDQTQNLPDLQALDEPVSETDDSAEPVIDTETQTLTDIELAVHSPHVEASPPEAEEANEDAARNAVEAAYAMGGNNALPKPIAALNAQPLGPELHAPEVPQPAYQPAPGFESSEQTNLSSPFNTEPLPGGSPADQTLDMPVPSSSPDGMPPPPSAFPGSMPQKNDSLPPPPTVPPPPVFQVT